jgi:heme exporter protein A
MLEIEARNITKIFNEKIIFKDICFNLNSGESMGITGKNGAGKTTLIKIIAGVLSLSLGSIVFKSNSSEINNGKIFNRIGFVSPYLNLYDEFSAMENLIICDKILGNDNKLSRYESILSLVSLYDRRNDPVRIYSSGMKQRLKYALALINYPELLLLDEPMSNLDAEGMIIVQNIINEQRDRGILILATNEESDLKYCNKIINLDDEKNN